MQRHASSHQASIATLWNNSNQILIAVFKAFRYLLCCYWCDHNRTNTYVFIGEVSYEGIDLILIMHHVLWSDDLLEGRNVLVRENCKLRLSLFLGINCFRCVGDCLCRALIFGIWTAFLHNRCFECLWVSVWLWFTLRAFFAAFENFARTLVCTLLIEARWCISKPILLHCEQLPWSLWAKHMDRPTSRFLKQTWSKNGSQHADLTQYIEYQWTQYLLIKYQCQTG